jgi:hypothetical protein
MRFRKLLCLIPLYLQSIAAADVQLSALFSDHMVLQRDRPITVWGWGWGSPGEKVQVSLTSSDPTRTEVAQDRKWVWADAKIVGSSVVCSHSEVPQPVALRYAFSMNPEGANLYNQDGLPASPFRTDDW